MDGFMTTRKGGLRMKAKWLCLLLVLLLAVGCASGTERSTPSEGHLEIGSIVETTSSADQIIVATTQENYKQFMKCLVAGDRTGADEMYRKGQIFQLETGTKVKVIRATLRGIEVRVQEGQNKDKIAWISLDFLKL